MTAAIHADGVRQTFGDVVALDGLDLTVEAGTVFGLLGPNGAGKTTLVKVLSTLLKPTGGSARILGHDVVAEPLAVRRRIGLAGQFAAVDEELTGRENLEMVGRLYRLPVKEAKARAADVLERFGLTEAADRRVATYSGGMRRRLDLGASLTGRPPVMLLDEPTTGLDPRTRQELWNTVDELRRDGTTVLLTTQYLEEADRLAQRIAVVDHGKIAARGDREGAQGDGGCRGALGARRSRARGRRRRRAERPHRRAARRRRRGRDPPRGHRPERLRGGRAPARLQGRADRRDRAPAAQPRRRLPHADRKRRPHERRSHPPHVRRGPRRQPRDGDPPAAQDPAQAGLRHLRLRPARDVRAAVPLRLRRRDQHRRRRLRRLPDARHHRPDGGVRRADDRHRPQHRCRHGRGRPLPLAADLALGGAVRPHGGRHRPERDDADRDDAGRHRGRVPARASRSGASRSRC